MRNPLLTQAFSEDEQLEASKYERKLLDAFELFRASIEKTSNLISPRDVSLKDGDLQSVTLEHLDEVSSYYNLSAHPVYARFSDQEILSREVLRNFAEPFNPYLSSSDFHWTYQTSGSSGRPLKVVRSSFSQFLNLFQTIARTALRFGISDFGKKEVCSVFLTDNPELEAGATADPSGITGLQVILPVRSTNQKELRHALKELRSLDAEFLTTKPNLLVLLTQEAAESEIRPSFKMIATSGAQLKASVRAEAARVFGCPVVSSYNTTELGYVGSECAQSFIHIDTTLHLPEILTSTGEILREGKGDLLITTLSNDCMPLLRYKTGDQAELINSGCSCQMPGPYLKSLLGRSLPVFDCGEGLRFSPSKWMKFFEMFPEVHEYQAVQVTSRKFRVGIELGPKCEWTSSLSGRIQHFFSNDFPDVNFEIHQTQFPNSQDGKFIRFKSEVTHAL